MSATVKALTTGLEVNGYRLEQQLGSGATGEVWCAVESNGLLNKLAHQKAKRVAIKFMNAALLHSEAAAQHRARFTYEIGALAELSGAAAVPTLYKFDLDYERPYFVMQYIPGRTYETLIRTGKVLDVPLHTRLTAISTLAQTLKQAHEAGIIHRDIKPANIKGIETPYLLDFGIALDVDQAHNAQPHVGTGIYMPPLDEPLDERSDIYSFAIVAYEILFGLHPIFTPETIGKDVLETRQLAGEFLKCGAWRVPSLIPSGELPRALHQADLSGLDAVFQQAFGARQRRFTDPSAFVEALTPLLPDKDAQQHTYLPAKPVIRTDQYTMIEVQREEATTETELPKTRKQPRKRNLWQRIFGKRTARAQ